MGRTARAPVVACVAQALAFCACDGGTAASGDAGADAAVRREVIFPANFIETYREMRDCRFSHDHDLHYIRVLASPTAQAPYAALSPDTPYPISATLVKIEYDEEACSAPVQYTAIRKVAVGENPDGGDWRWQRVSVEREVLDDGAPARCVQCHTWHCAPPGGYDLTCAEQM